MLVLGLELRSSFFCGKHFTELTITLVIWGFLFDCFVLFFFETRSQIVLASLKLTVLPVPTLNSKLPARFLSVGVVVCRPHPTGSLLTRFL